MEFVLDAKGITPTVQNRTNPAHSSFFQAYDMNTLEFSISDIHPTLNYYL
jgi:hypothetical protein